MGLEIYVRDDYNGAFNDAIEAWHGFSGELEPTPVLLGTVRLGEKCIRHDNISGEKKQINVFPTITNGKIYISNPGERVLDFM